jgi:hypothetical protein
MVRRPTSITVIAVLQLVLGVLGVFSGVTSLIPRGAAAESRRAEWRATHPTPVPTPVQQAKSVLNTLIALVTGYYLLREELVADSLPGMAIVPASLRIRGVGSNQVVGNIGIAHVRSDRLLLVSATG